MTFKERYNAIFGTGAADPAPSPRSSAAEAEDIMTIVERRMKESADRLSEQISKSLFADDPLTKPAPPPTPDPLPMNPALGEAIMVIARRCAAELGGTEEKWRKSICDRANDRPLRFFNGIPITSSVQFAVRRKNRQGKIDGWTV